MQENKHHIKKKQHIIKKQKQLNENTIGR